MNRMFDHNHDGMLSAGERMERDYYVLSKVMNRSTSGEAHCRPAGSGSGHAGMRILGFLAMMIGVNALFFFPGFALIMLALAVILYIC